MFLYEIYNYFSCFLKISIVDIFRLVIFRMCIIVMRGKLYTVSHLFIVIVVDRTYLSSAHDLHHLAFLSKVKTTKRQKV